MAHRLEFGHEIGCGWKWVGCICAELRSSTVADHGEAGSRSQVARLRRFGDTFICVSILPMIFAICLSSRAQTWVIRRCSAGAQAIAGADLPAIA
jgi:hypothetical protein